MTPDDTPFAVDRDGETLFIRLDASGVPDAVVPLVGLRVLYPRGEDAPYILVRDAIRVHRAALRQGRIPGLRAVLKQLRLAMRAFDDGDMEII